MMKHISKVVYKQNGFALIDVLIAALVLSVGVIAFVKLGNLNIKRAQQADYRLQATTASNAVIETLRSDPDLLPVLVGNAAGQYTTVTNTRAIAVQPLACTGANGLNVLDPTTWCPARGAQMAADLTNEINATFSDAFKFIPGKASLCINTDGVASRPYPIRITIVWKNATQVGGSPVFVAADDNVDCPAGYDNETNPIPNANNVNDIRPDRGYFEIYTSI